MALLQNPGAYAVIRFLGLARSTKWHFPLQQTLQGLLTQMAPVEWLLGPWDVPTVEPFIALDLTKG